MLIDKDIQGNSFALKKFRLKLYVSDTNDSSNAYIPNSCYINNLWCFSGSFYTAKGYYSYLFMELNYHWLCTANQMYQPNNGSNKFSNITMSDDWSSETLINKTPDYIKPCYSFKILNFSKSISCNWKFYGIRV